METKTSRLRAAKVQSTGSGVGPEKFYSQPGSIPNSGAHSRKQSGEGTQLNQLEAVDKLEIICATEPNDASDDFGKLELLDDEDKGDEVLCDV